MSLITGMTATHGTKMYYSISCSRQLRGVSEISTPHKISGMVAKHQTKLRLLMPSAANKNSRRRVHTYREASQASLRPLRRLGTSVYGPTSTIGLCERFLSPQYRRPDTSIHFYRSPSSPRRTGVELVVRLIQRAFRLTIEARAC
jgi:hypothetical protein